MNSEFKMRTSKVLRKLRAGQTAFFTKMNLADSRAYEIAASSGFDCLWTCQEHIGTDYKTLEAQILATKIYDCDLLCRVPKGCYSNLIRPLEMDATGIMVPHVMSLSEAQSIVKDTRFHPVGRRPLDGGNADGSYCRVPLSEYLEQANRERFVAMQIEDPEPLAELDAIAALPGYDMLFFGPGDFSHSIGDPGNFNNQKLIDARRQVANTALKHGKFAGTVASLENYRSLIEEGYSFISIGADVVTLGNNYKNMIRTIFSGQKEIPTRNTLYSE